jgi:hypothetical protein
MKKKWFEIVWILVFLAAYASVGSYGCAHKPCDCPQKVAITQEQFVRSMHK